MSRTFRNVVATLLIAITAALAGAAPSHANPVSRHRTFEDPARIQPSVRSFLASLLAGIFEFAGGGMDPNGRS